MICTPDDLVSLTAARLMSNPPSNKEAANFSSDVVAAMVRMSVGTYFTCSA